MSGAIRVDPRESAVPPPGTGLRRARSDASRLEVVHEARPRVEADDVRRVGDEVRERVDVVEVRPAVAVVDQVLDAADVEVRGPRDALHGGIEYLIDDRDGRPCFFDVNALSNFVADAPNVIGFDPFARLADYLVREAEAAVGGKEAA